MIIPVLMLIAYSLSGQSDEVEKWRLLGWQAKTGNEPDSAIIYYRRIYDADPGDYDAKLALGRLYALTEDYRTAVMFFDEIYREDSTDIEALLGLGACYGILGSLDRAVDYYRQVIRIDDTFSEAWAGLGKMYFWMGKPKTALGFYEKALELDPGNEEIIKEYHLVKTELDYALTLSFGPVQEKEENYRINALISKVGFEKRINDQFHILASFLLDYSNRDYTADESDTTRWYSNTWVKGSWITRHHKVSAFSGYSMADNKLSAYGLNWKLNYEIGKVNIANSVNGGYDYFYYWNKVGGTSINDEIQLSYRFLKFSAGYTIGMIDAVTVYLSDGSTGIKQNPYQSYSLSLMCKVLKRPDIRIGIQNSYLDYQYKSPLYYSPFGRVLTGASASVYYSLHNMFIYSSFTYNIGTEYTRERKKDEKLNVDNWSANLELGYELYPFSFSIGGSNFYNPYYQNLTGFIALKILF